jgi:hypothetical protein
MHCVDFAILSRMQQELNIKKLSTWDKVEF